MKTIITAVEGSSSLRRAVAELRAQRGQGTYRPTVSRRHSGSTLIDALLVRALVGRKALLRCIVEWQRRVAGRRELTTLTDRDLHDIGIGRSEAEAEANKRFWET